MTYQLRKRSMIEGAAWWHILVGVFSLAALGCSARNRADRAPHEDGGVRRHASAAAALVPERRKTLGEDARALVKINSLLLAPVQFSGAARLDSGGQEQFNRQLELSASRQLTIELTGPSKLKESRQVLTEGPNFSSDATAMARKLGLDGVLLTTVTTMHKREGGAIGAYSPASLGFTMEVIRAVDRKSVWSSSYISHDEAIAANLFKLRDKVGPGRTAGWLSLDEVSGRGFDETLQEFAQRRDSAFSVSR